MDIRDFELRPTGNRVIVRPIKETKLRDSGIIIPETVKQGRAATGTVVSVGSGKWLTTGGFHPVDVKVGDVVLFNSYSGNSLQSKLRDREKSIDRPEEHLIILHADELLAIVHDDTTEEPVVVTD